MEGYVQIFQTEGRESTDTSQRSNPSIRNGKSWSNQQGKPSAGNQSAYWWCTAPAVQPKPNQLHCNSISKRNHLFSACELTPKVSVILIFLHRSNLFHSSCQIPRISFSGSELKQLATPALYTTHSQNYILN